MDNVDDDDDDDDVTQLPPETTSQKKDRSQTQKDRSQTQKDRSQTQQEDEENTNSKERKESFLVSSQLSTDMMEDVQLSPILSVDASQTCVDEDENKKSSQVKKSDVLNVQTDFDKKQISRHQRHDQMSPSRQVIRLRKSDVLLLPPDSDVSILPSTSVIMSDDASSQFEVSQTDSVCSDRRTSIDDDVPISERLKLRRVKSNVLKKKKKKKKKKRGSRLKLKRKSGNGKKRKKIGTKLKRHKDVECNANGWMESRSNTASKKKKKKIDDGKDGAATKIDYFGEVDSQKTLTQLWE